MTLHTRASSHAVAGHMTSSVGISPLPTLLRGKTASGASALSLGGGEEGLLSADL